MNDKGAIYVATGDSYLREAERSAKSLKHHMPDLPVTLFSDKKIPAGPDFDETRILKDCAHSFIDKIQPLMQSPYRRTVFLDSDTYVADNFDELFDLLDRFEIAAALDTWRIGDNVPECPHSFFEINTGVILFRRSPSVRAFLQAWLDEYRRGLKQLPPPINDQPSFRKILYQSPLAFYPLPPEYNYLLWSPGFVGRNSPVKILHGRNAEMEAIALRMNASRAGRVFLPTTADLEDRSFQILTPGGRKLGWFFSHVLHPVSKFRPRRRKPFSKKPL